MQKIGFIGLGRMGRPMASNLVRKGFQLVVNDVSEEAIQQLVALKATRAVSVADVAAQSDIVVTMLFQQPRSSPAIDCSNRHSVP